MVPSAGLGANLAILDGVHLCNLLVDMPSPTQENIAIVFENYFGNRSKIAQAALDNARQFGKVMSNRVRFSFLFFPLRSYVFLVCCFLMLILFVLFFATQKGFVSEVVRKIFFNYIPDWMTRMQNTQRLQLRPQLHFLPQVPDRGTPKAQPQEPRLFVSAATA